MYGRPQFSFCLAIALGIDLLLPHSNKLCHIYSVFRTASSLKINFDFVILPISQVNEPLAYVHQKTIT